MTDSEKHSAAIVRARIKETRNRAQDLQVAARTHEASGMGVVAAVLDAIVDTWRRECNAWEGALQKAEEEAL
jgi:hypothetical protein